MTWDFLECLYQTSIQVDIKLILPALKSITNFVGLFPSQNDDFAKICCLFTISTAYMGAYCQYWVLLDISQNLYLIVSKSNSKK